MASVLYPSLIFGGLLLGAAVSLEYFKRLENDGKLPHRTTNFFEKYMQYRDKQLEKYIEERQEKAFQKVKEKNT
jgi:hypothetical protein